MQSMTYYCVLQSRALNSANDRRHPFDEYLDLGAVPSAGWIRYIDGMRIGSPVHKNRHELPFFDERPHHEIHCMNNAQPVQRSCKVSIALTNEHVVARTFQRDFFVRSTKLERLHEASTRRKVSDHWHVLLNDLSWMFRYAVFGQVVRTRACRPRKSADLTRYQSGIVSRASNPTVDVLSNEVNRAIGDPEPYLNVGEAATKAGQIRNDDAACSR